MIADVAYCRPRGIYGRYVFTVVLYFQNPTESENIAVSRSQTTYSCHTCGRWAEIATYVAINPSQRVKKGAMILYRYDNVEPGDTIRLTMQDSELLLYQITSVGVGFDRVTMNSQCVLSRPGLDLPLLGSGFGAQQYPQAGGWRASWDAWGMPQVPSKLYDVNLIDWDTHMYESQGQKIRIVEELIQQTMNKEPIKIRELVLLPSRQRSSIPQDEDENVIEGDFEIL
jgi:hypothetical protein